MNKNDFISLVAEKSELTKTDAGKAVDAFLEGVTEVLAEGNDVRFVGFGTFAISERQAKTGRNPRTGEPIQIPASNQPKFKAGKALKDAVNK